MPRLIPLYAGKPNHLCGGNQQVTQDEPVGGQSEVVMKEATLRKEYFDNQLTIMDIAEKYGKGYSTVNYYFKKYDISPLKPHERMDVPDLSNEQRSFLIGTMLGDGSLELAHTGMNARLHVEHTVDQVDYVIWKHHLIKPFVTGPVKYRERSRKGNKSIMCGFRTVSHPIFTDLHRMFYDAGVKVVTNEIARELTPMALAVWLMDDGSKNGNSTIFCTHSFTRPELERLQSELSGKFKINTTLQAAGHRKGSNQKMYNIYVLKNSMERLVELLRPYVIEPMQYKLEPSLGNLRGHTWNPNGEDMVQALQIL